MARVKKRDNGRGERMRLIDAEKYEGKVIADHLYSGVKK